MPSLSIVSNVDFDDQISTSEGEQQQVEVSNDGVDVLIVSEIEVPNGFEIIEDVVFPVSIQPGETEVFNLKRVTMVVGDITKNLVIVSNDPNNKTNVTVSGKVEERTIAYPITTFEVNL